MKFYRCLCRKCSTTESPEFRDHIEDKRVLTCQHCGLELFIVKKDEKRDIYELEEGNGRKRD